MLCWILQRPHTDSACPFALLLLLAGPACAATVQSMEDGDTMLVVDGSKRLTIRARIANCRQTDLGTPWW